VREYYRLIEGRIRPSPLDGVIASDGKKSTLGAPEPRAQVSE
jgi:hypothetical protein